MEVEGGGVRKFFRNQPPTRKNWGGNPIKEGRGTQIQKCENIARVIKKVCVKKLKKKGQGQKSRNAIVPKKGESDGKLVSLRY